MPHGIMRRLAPSLLILSTAASASHAVFSVHDDLLAHPQFEVILSNSFISDSDANHLLSRAAAAAEPRESSNLPSVDSSTPSERDGANRPVDPTRELYEVMWLDHQPQLCAIPIVKQPLKNETSEAEARAAEQKELARAMDRGWELLQDLEGNCLYFISGWWSYQFCYNGEITQFHQLGREAGRVPFPPQRDPTTPEFTLGKVKTAAKDTISHEDEWGNRIDSRRARKASESARTELQTKGDTRYLVQKMDGGSICDLTGKPRQVEVQFHCMPQLSHDRIGSIKEITTCSYLLVVHTPRLCNDVAFMPPKEHDALPIVCRPIVPQDEMATRSDRRALSADTTPDEEASPQIIIGGIPVGAGQFVGREGQRMPVPVNFGKEDLENPGVETIAVGKSQADGGEVEMASDEALEKLDLDPKIVEELRREVQKIAREKGWKIEVVDAPGEIREIFGIVEDEDEDEDEDGDGDGDGEGQRGEEASTPDKEKKEGEPRIVKGQKVAGAKQQAEAKDDTPKGGGDREGREGREDREGGEDREGREDGEDREDSEKGSQEVFKDEL